MSLRVKIRGALAQFAPGRIGKITGTSVIDDVVVVEPDPVEPEPTPVDGQRNVVKHPYRGSWTPGAANGTWSCWNTPIGSGAVLTDSGLQNVTTSNGAKTIKPWVSSDPIHIGYTSDPVRTLTTSDVRLPGFSARVHVRSDDTGPGDYSRGNSIFAYHLEKDPTRVWQGHPLLLSAGGNPSTRYIDPTTPDDLYGQGHYGAHGGAHTTALGCIRQWEWDSPNEDEIKHAISYNIFAAFYLRGIYQNETNSPHRWPANSADGYWNKTSDTKHYGQFANVPAGMYMGALLTVPSSYTWSSSLPLNTRKVMRAIKNFGLIVADDSAWEVHQISVESTISLGAQPTDTFHTPILNMIKACKLVSNNSPTNVGGGGTPRTALVPDVTRP